MNETVRDFLVRHPSRRLARGLALLSLALAGAAGTGVAQAGGAGWSVGVFLPPVLISGGHPGYPPPVYGPPPVAYYPPPVVYGPPPRWAYVPPVVYRPAPPGWRPHHGHERRGGHGRGHGAGSYGHGDSDRWQDRDGDGVPNLWDRRD